MARVVVIGAGLGGLAAAVRLAKLGHQVTVMERTGRIGGVLGSHAADGFRWDTGAASTTLPAALRDLFRKSGRPLEQVAQLKPIDEPRRHIFTDGSTLDLPIADRAEQLGAWREFADHHTASRWTDLIDSYAETWELLRKTALENPLPDRTSLKMIRVLKPRRSLRSVARRLEDPRAQAVLNYYATSQRSEPDRTPGFLGVTAYAERTFGRWTFPDGFSVLTEALAKRLTERQVEVELGAEVTAVVTENGVVRGIRLADGTLRDADVVVSDIEPRVLYEQLVDDPAAAKVRKQVSRTHDALAAYVIHLGLRDPVPDLPFETVLHGDPIVVVRTGGQAPPGHRAWSVLVYGYPTDDALDLLTARGLDVRDRVVSRQPAASWLAGVAWEGSRTARRRAGNVSPVKGLYCVGAGAHPGCGVPATALGAALVANAIGKA